jgi:glycosyltransferase involved in cell wall biosynthesis
MKIAVIGAKGIPAKQGGIERYCQEFYPRVVQQGHEVDLFARPSYDGQSWFSSYTYQGVKVICLPSLAIRGLDAFISSAFGAIASVIDRYDVVHFHALGPALFCWLPKLVASSRVIVTCQGLDWQRAKWGKVSSYLIRLGERNAVKYADEIVVVSKALQTYFKQTYGIETKYIPNGPGSYQDSDRSFSYTRSLGLQPDRYILYLGRLVPEKRPELLIAAFQKLQLTTKFECKLVLAGGISDTASYSAELLKMAGSDARIVFTNEIKGRKLAEIVRGAGLFVLPSDLEGLPLVMLEAMKEGIPVLGSDIPPHKQLIGHNRGLLFKAGDLDSLVNCLQKALEQPERLRIMADKARDYVNSNYSWDKIVYDNLALYCKNVEPSVVIENKDLLKTIEPNIKAR